MPDDWRGIFLAHAVRYPAAGPEDLVKLAYQAEHGGGHLVTDGVASLEWIRTETASLGNRPTDRLDGDGNGSGLIEDIGNGFCRLHLGAAAAAGIRPDTVNRLFLAGARSVTGSREGLLDRLDILRQCCAEGLLPFSPDALAGYLSDYAAREYPPISHSDVYRSAYRPAYRVVRQEYAAVLPVIRAIVDRLADRPAGAGSLTVAIEGPCGAGKSTLARHLAALYPDSAEILHMDDFFLPPELRTAERLAEPGGNIHYERFRDEVGAGLRSGEPFEYRVFDCSEQAYAATVRVRPAPLVIVEGVYAMQPIHGIPYGLSVFLSLSRAEQARRVRERSGPELWERFRQEWIPMENRYFETFRIREQCDLVCGEPY